MKPQTVTIHPRQPFDFGLTAGYHTYFRGIYAADRFEDGVYSRVLDVNGRPVLASARQAGEALEVSATGDGVTAQDAQEAARRISWLLGCDVDLSGFYSTASGDPVLSRIVRRLSGLHPPRTLTLFEALVLAVTGQQIASSVAAIIRQLMVHRLGASLSVDGAVYHTFPTPEAVLLAGLPGLRALKLSGRKAEYILDIASKSLDGTLSETELRGLPDGEVEQRLLSVRGVGPWTVSWAMQRGLGRENAFPSSDLALQRVMSRLYFGGRRLSVRELEGFSQRWRPYRSFVTLYTFAAARMGVLPDAEAPQEVGP